MTRKLLESLGADRRSLKVVSGDFALGMIGVVKRRIVEHGWDPEARAFNCLVRLHYLSIRSSHKSTCSQFPYDANTFDYVFTNSQFQFMLHGDLAVKGRSSLLF